MGPIAASGSGRFWWRSKPRTWEIVATALGSLPLSMTSWQDGFAAGTEAGQVLLYSPGFGVCTAGTTIGPHNVHVVIAQKAGLLVASSQIMGSTCMSVLSKPEPN